MSPWQPEENSEMARTTTARGKSTKSQARGELVAFEKKRCWAEKLLRPEKILEAFGA
jgi:hypothetical protein